MNEYEMMVEGLENFARDGKINRSTADEHVKIYKFLSTCSERDICTLFNSAIFNEIVMCYVRKAVSELMSEDILNEEQARAIRNRVSLLFDEKLAEEVLEG